jgi:hypothetical protein
MVKKNAKADLAAQSRLEHDKDEADGIMRFAKTNKCSRSEVIRNLVGDALADLKS